MGNEFRDDAATRGHLSYEFRVLVPFRELKARKVRAPVTIIRATGDDYSFIEAVGDGHES